MQGVVLVTDYEWFTFLSRQPGLDEVNFWRPSDVRKPRQFVPGTPTIFKLKKRYGDWIVGFGVFARHDVLPLWWVWDTFGTKNGAGSLGEFRSRISALASEPGERKGRALDHLIGCLMLSQPVFFDRESWIKPPADWPTHAVQGKAYDLTEGEGARVWDECRAAALQYPAAATGADFHADPRPRYGEGILVTPRLGQGTFRNAVTDAYGKSCAVSGEHSLPALEAAHIRPYGDGGEHEIVNGLLLRSDIHRLFDRGYVGVTPDYRFMVSKHLRGDYSNGRSYDPFNGQLIAVPSRAEHRPDPAALEWHRSEVFRG